MRIVHHRMGGQPVHVIDLNEQVLTSIRIELGRGRALYLSEDDNDGFLQIRSHEGVLVIQPQAANAALISVSGIAADHLQTRKVDEFGRTWAVVEDGPNTNLS